MSEALQVPVRVRIHLAHATVQAIADDAGVDVLHIKGPTVDESLRPARRSSIDADVLVRPAHLHRFLDGLKVNGWTQMTMMRSGGLVEHSTNWFHPQLGQIDVHLRFPGIQVDSAKAFDALWRDHRFVQVARRSCTVPGLTAQRLVLLLHAARGLSRHGEDVRRCWDEASSAERAAVVAMATELRAQVALAAATGRLEEFRDQPEYDLWRLYVDETITKAGFKRIAAEIKAAPDGISHPRLRVTRYAIGAFFSMSQRVSNQTGRRASLREVASAYRTFIRRGRDAF